MTESAQFGLHPTESQHAPLVYRELHEPSDIVAFLRLRHRVYFEQNRYGEPKPLGLDLTAYDARSRMFGVFVANSLVAGVRLVFREPQQHADAIRAIHAVAGTQIRERSGRQFPSEESFELGSVVGLHQALIDFEVGRLVALAPGLGAGMVRELLLATLGMAHLAGCRFYLYSASIAMGRRYAAITNPRWQLEEGFADGIESDGFRFPKTSIAAVAAVDESPFLGRVLAYAREIEECGFAGLRADSQLEVRA